MTEQSTPTAPGTSHQNLAAAGNGSPADIKSGTLVDLYLRSCAKYAERPLYGTKKNGVWVWTTYAELRDLVDRCRAGLALLGISKGDRVAVISDNRVEWAVAAYGTYGLEAVLVPMYQAQRSDERQFILQDSGAKVAIVANDAIRADLQAMSLPNLLHVISLEGPATDPTSWAGMLAAGERAPLPPRRPDPEDVAGFIYTSGTTGKPKGVLLSHRNIASNVGAVHEVFTLEPEDRSLCFLPWAHSYGQLSEVHLLISMGCSAALNDDTSKLLEDLAEVKPTVLFAVPRIFNRIYEAVNKEIARRPGFIQRLIRAGIHSAIKREHGERLGPIERVELALDDKVVFAKIRDRFGGRLKYAISGSASLGREVADFVNAVGIMVYEAYGLTETSPVVSANVPGPGRRRLGSVGRVLPGVRVVIDHTVGDVPEHGEIVVYGPNVMIGYHQRPEENEKALMKDGGFRTGDLGYIDDDGFLYVTGRRKEQYKLENGKYVMPSLLEEDLKLSPFIANVMVHGDGRPFNVAIVALNEPRVREWAESHGVVLGADLTRDENVRTLVRDELALHTQGFKPFERPIEFAIVAEDFTTKNALLTPTLKLRRRDIVARYGAVIDGLYAKKEQPAAATARA